jgi:protein-tyrosine phosphatase
LEPTVPDGAGGYNQAEANMTGQEFKGMIDIHTHILPGLDDGAHSWEEAMAMAQGAAKDGIAAVVATPHIYEDSGITPEEIREKARKLQDMLDSQEINLHVFPGAEVHLAVDLPDRIRDGRLQTLANAGRYLLVEFPFGLLPVYTDEVLFELQASGVIPIIAHPERNESVQKDPNLLHGMIRKGMLAQLTGGSLRGNFGSKVEYTAKLLLKHSLVQILASDGHRADRRRILLSKASGVVADLAGIETAQAMTILNPRKITQGIVFDPRESREIRGLSGFVHTMTFRALR